jgi:dolichyl-phosphate-mannose-protein mannosyltransferase
MKYRILVFTCFLLFLFSFTGFTTITNAPNNIVLNPGFEEGLNKEPYFWTNEAWDNGPGKAVFNWDRIEKHSGNSSVCITNFFPDDSRYSQVIKVKSSSFYKISCYIKTEKVGTEAKGANISVKGITVTSEDIKGTSNGWKYVELYGKSDTKQKEFTITLGLGGYGSINTGKAWFDDLNIQEVASIPTDKNYMNLFVNTGTSRPSTGPSDIAWFWPLLIIILVLIFTGFLIVKNIKSEKELNKEEIISPQNIIDSKISKHFFDKRDIIIMLSMTFIYLAIALFNLGSTKAPITSWSATSTGESFVLDLGKTVDLSRIYYFNSLGKGNYIFEYLDATGKYKSIINEEINSTFTWKYVLAPIKTNKIKVSVNKPGAVLNEIGIIIKGSKVPLKNIRITDKNIDLNDLGTLENLIDEQNTVDYYCSFMTGTYFDEIYHAKTAYEQLKHIEPTENSHPPLGKILISIGIVLFGMNPFGWRIIGTLFGAGMIPLMYIFAKKMFNNKFFAFCAAFLMMFDFMHFVQTRIATIDVYGTFFVILMYYYMYDYFTNESYNMGLKESLKPLFLSGFFFGLGAASKWIALYGAGGLALLFFTAKFLEYMKYKKELHMKVRKEWVNKFISNYIGLTFLWCILFFIIIPGVIYLLSYIPYMMVKDAHHGLRDVINLQVFMYDYHKNLVADHFFKSKWYTWPFDYKPMWYYMGTDLPKGMAASITSMGNPAIWWLGVLAVPLSGIIAFVKRDKKMLVIFIAIAFQYLPWIFISRITFIYHYFSTIPFMILSIVYIIKFALEKLPMLKYSVYAYLAVTLLLFIAFYPVLSGMEVPKLYIDNYLRWFKGSWYF